MHANPANSDRSDWGQPQRLLLLAALVCLSCWASIALTRGEGRIAAIWLSNGLVLGVLLCSASRAWLRVLAASYAGNVVANLAVSDSPVLALALAACNVVEIGLAAWPLRRRFGEKPDLSSGLWLLYFLTFALLVAPAVSSWLAALVFWQQGGVTVPQVFALWFPADCMGLLIVTPLTLALLSSDTPAEHRLGHRDTLLPWLLLALTSLAVFTQDRYPMLFLPLPPLLLLVYRKGLPGAALGLATITVIGVSATAEGHGPLWLIRGVTEHGRVFFLQLYLITAAATGLVVGMLLTQRARLSAALQRSEEQMRAVTDNLPALIAHLDTGERYRFVNAHIGKVFGNDTRQMIGRTLREVRGEAIYADIAPHVRAALAGETVSFESQGLANGRSYHYQSNYIPDLAHDGRVQGFYAMTFDITARKQAELRQAASEERLATITDNLPGLVAYLDREGICRFCNAMHAAWFAKPVEHWLGSDYRQGMGQGFAEAIDTPLQAALAGTRTEAELALPCAGARRNVSATFVPHLDHVGAVQGAYVFMHDVTGLKTVQTELEQMASRDMLTGLSNRREFQQRLADTIGRNRRAARPVALMFLDVDHFKAINDRHGHAGGDAVLREVALRLSASVRHSDTVARLAGDEFVVILDGLHEAGEPQFVARKIVAAMQKPVLLPSGECKVGVSIGVAFDAAAAMAPDALLSLADGALYEAKAAGRNTWRMADGRQPRPQIAAVLG